MENGIWCASGTELTILANIIAIYIGEIYDVSALNTIANFFEIIGDALELLAAQKSRCSNSIKTSEDSKNYNINNLFSE